MNRILAAQPLGVLGVVFGGGGLAEEDDWFRVQGGRMGDVTASLDAIERMGTHAQKIEEYKKLAEALFKAGARETPDPQL